MKMCLAVLGLLVAMAVSQTEQPVRMPENVAIFAVRHDGQALSIEPVVIVHNGGDQSIKTVPAFNSPLPTRNLTDADFDTIGDSYYKPGTSVSVFSGGMKLGIAQVLKSSIEGKDGACVDLSAVISYNGGRAPLLASSAISQILGHNSTRRAATITEKLILRELAIQWLADYGLDRQLLQRAHLRNVVSTVLRTSGGRAVIGRLDVASKRAIHRLFVIAENDNGHYHLTLTNLEIQNDIEDDTDKAESEYVDQLDIDDDGTDEIVTSTSDYESWGYTVWKFDSNGNFWRKAYSGLGGGC